MYQVIKKSLIPLIMGVSSLSISPAGAESTVPEPVKYQIPGYYRMILGDFEVTALYDGYTSLANELFHGISQDDFKTVLDNFFVDSENGVQTAVNAYLINTKTHLILIDTGAALCYGETLGQIEDNINAAGYKVTDIDTVLLTHLHPDHACGLIKEGQPLFPKATVYTAQHEADYWLNKELTKKADPAMKTTFEMAQASVAPYEALNQFKTYSKDATTIDGIQGLNIINSNGHTPGHSSYLFNSRGEELLVWGDIVHSHATQFPYPDISVEFDVDEKAAIVSRKAMMSFAAKEKLWIAGAHIPFPGLGHIKVEGSGYRWVPIEYKFKLGK